MKIVSFVIALVALIVIVLVSVAVINASIAIDPRTAADARRIDAMTTQYTENSENDRAWFNVQRAMQYQQEQNWMQLRTVIAAGAVLIFLAGGIAALVALIIVLAVRTRRMIAYPPIPPALEGPGRPSIDINVQALPQNSATPFLLRSGRRRTDSRAGRR